MQIRTSICSVQVVENSRNIYQYQLYKTLKYKDTHFYSCSVKAVAKVPDNNELKMLGMHYLLTSICGKQNLPETYFEPDSRLQKLFCSSSR